MKAVALISGGKDSCFSIHLCQQHGHQIVALANLLPTDSSIDELDSYMYQTVGHQLVAAYAACTGLPLYRRRITGCSSSQGLSYSVTSGDEVEDLFLLLAYIKERHPDITSVASGAIASDYQRLRVESVCSRLGLVSLAYLWHQPQDKLLSDMVTNDIEAVLVKVAAMGLDPHRHLGKSISQLQTHLRRLRDTYGCNVCGEGGEYETLTLDCPAFKHGRIVLDDWQVVLHSPDSIAPVGVLHPTSFHVEQKQRPAHHSPAATSADEQQQQADEPLVVEVPADWQPVQHTPGEAVDSFSAAPQQSVQQQSLWHTGLKVTESPQQVHIIAAVTPAAGAVQPVNAAATAGALAAGLLSVSAYLSAVGMKWSNSLFVHMYLADMSHFGAANTEYCKHLPQVNPPSRACVQVPLPAGCPVLLDVLFAKPSRAADSLEEQQPDAAASCEQQLKPQLNRRILHVQSVSSWAPSCIGPYSQATSCNGLVYMAGQIPLDPATMNIMQSPSASVLAPGNGSSSGVSPEAVAGQVWRTLRNCQAVAVAVKSCVATASLALTVYLTAACAAAGGQAVVAAALEAVWVDRDILDSQPVPQAVLAAAAKAGGADGCDPGSSSWEQQQQSVCVCAAVGVDSGHDDDGHEGCHGENDKVIDDYLRPPGVLCCEMQPAVLYVTVPALPRGALLEIQPILLDLATASDQADSSSSSSSGEETAQLFEKHAEHPFSGLGSPEHAVGSLEQQYSGTGVVTHTSPAACAKCTNRWERILLHLQSVTSTANGNSHSISASCTSQLVAAAAQLSAVLNDVCKRNLTKDTRNERHHQPAVCILRCYYVPTSSPDSNAAAPGSLCVSWQDAFTSMLQKMLSLVAQQRCVSVQYVPVSSITSSVQNVEDCWGILEAFVCR